VQRVVSRRVLPPKAASSKAPYVTASALLARDFFHSLVAQGSIGRFEPSSGAPVFEGCVTLWNSFFANTERVHALSHHP
jgi:hypothetical protein